MVAPVLLSACLNQAGISARGIDFSAEFVREFSAKPYWASIRNLLSIGYVHKEKLPRRALIDIFKFTRRFLLDLNQQYQPEWIGLSVFTSESLDFSLVLSYFIRKYLPNTKIIAGGKGLEVQHNGRTHSETFVKNQIVDAVIVGDAETAIINVIQNNLTGLIHSDSQTKEDLDLIPTPQWSDYDLKLYASLRSRANIEVEPYMAITSSKGCVRQCSFCDVASFWPKFIFRDPKKVADEIITNYRTTGIKHFKFTDNLINGSSSAYREINQILAREIPREITYSGYAIFKGKTHMPASDFDIAAEAGCVQWAIGVESGSERIRYDMKKKITDDDVDWAVHHLHRVGIHQSWLFIVGYPTETEEDFQLTLNMLERYAHLNVNNMISITVSPPFSLLENSPLFTDHDYGFSDNLHQKFWTTSINENNTFPVRADRWRRAVKRIEELGYTFTHPLNDKWNDEINSLEEIWNEKYSKVIPIYPT